MDNTECTRYWGKKIRDIAGSFPALRAVEQRFVYRGPYREAPPLFIVGVPRSGSTLLYQLLAYYYDCAYFTNVSSTFYQSPALATYLTRGLFKPYQASCFTSDYGLVEGLWAPSEAGAIFHAWFDNEEVDRSLVRNTCYKIAHLLGGTFIWKNLNNSMHLEKLYEIFPEAIFVCIRRDPIFTCQSIVLGRRKNKISAGSQEGEVEERGTFEKVAQEMAGIENGITSFFNKTGCNRVIIKYSDLCEDHARELERTEAAYQELGYKFAKQRPFEALGLRRSEEVRLPADEWRALTQIFTSNQNLPDLKPQ